MTCSPGMPRIEKLQDKMVSRNGRDRFIQSSPALVFYVGGLLHDVKAILVVACHVPGLLVVKKRIERVSLVGPHL